VATTPDAGAGIGNTFTRMCGAGQGHINMTVNGILVNDAELHSVF